MAVTPGAVPLGTTALVLKKGTYVPIEGTVGTLVDTITTTQSDGTVVNRQVLVIGDPENIDNLAGVAEDTLVKGEYGLRVFDTTTSALLSAIEKQTTVLEKIERHLSEGSDEHFEEL